MLGCDWRVERVVERVERVERVVSRFVSRLNCSRLRLDAAGLSPLRALSSPVRGGAASLRLATTGGRYAVDGR